MDPELMVDTENPENANCEKQKAYVIEGSACQVSDKQA